MSEGKVDWDRPVQRRDGAAVRVLCTDADGMLPVVVLVKYNSTKGDYVDRYALDGTQGLGESFNNHIINIPPPKVKVKVTRWAHVFPNENDYYLGHMFSSEAKAKANCPSWAIATIKVEFEVDETEVRG